MGRPSSYDDRWEFYCHLAYTTCAETGATGHQLAKIMGISVSCYDRWHLNYPEFNRSIRLGRQKWDTENIQKSLRIKALGREYTEVEYKHIPIKDENGRIIDTQKIPVKETTKLISPDTGACIFWLCNRNPKEWKRNLDIKLNGRVDHRHAHIHKLDLAQLKNNEVKILQKLLVKDIPEENPFLPKNI